MCTVDKKTCPDKLVVAIGLCKLRPCFTNAVPVCRRVEDQHVLHLVVTLAQPPAEQRGLRPGALTQARPIGFACVLQCRVLRRDTAVDDADDYAVAVETLGTTQASRRIEQPEGIGTEIRRKRAYLVFPYAQHFWHMFDLIGLCRCHARGEAVDGVTVTVNRLDVRTGAPDYFCLFSFQTQNMRLDRCIVLVENGY